MFLIMLALNNSNPLEIGHLTVIRKTVLLSIFQGVGGGSSLTVQYSRASGELCLIVKNVL